MRLSLMLLFGVFLASLLSGHSAAQQKTDTVSKITALENKWCDA